MTRWFHRLRVSQKLMLISIIFMIPDSVLLTLFLLSINENIRFARWEQFGNEYQRPLEELLEWLPQHHWQTQDNRSGTAAPSDPVASKIDLAFGRLLEVDARLGEKLQFTQEGLAKRHREHCQVRTVQEEWDWLKTNAPRMDAKECAAKHLHLISDVRTMITHVGDESNLILDPDLDSYYLMDVTLLALPQMQDRLWSILEYAREALNDQTLSQVERRHLAVDAALLQEADLDRVVASTQTALNEDANFYGRSKSLQERVPPSLAEFTRAAHAFITLISQWSESEHPVAGSQEFFRLGNQARQASFALWIVADEELDELLEKRMQSYRARRARSLLLTGLALVAAISFVAFITQSISKPLQRQAAELRKSNEALQSEVQERQRVAVALQQAEEKYRSIFENAVEGIFQTTPEGRFIVANPTLARIYGYDSVTELQASLIDIRNKLYVIPCRREEFQELIGRLGQVQQFESQVYRKDGTVIWISEHARAVRDASGTLLYYEGTVEDISERKRGEAELEAVHKKLVDASRMAGMAEVATGVLHNVGNVLNSVNVSANAIGETLRRSKLANLSKLTKLIGEHRNGLGEFLERDPRGRQVPGYLDDLSTHLTKEQEGLLQRMDLLRGHLEHVKEIVAMQQDYARVSGVTESVEVTALVEDALRLHSGALSRHQVEVLREYEAQPVITVDKHKVLQILVNLIANAKYACASSGQPEKRLTLQVRNGGGRVRVAVADNGMGIPRENLVRIFNHGFTTRKDGHGFGLHSGALAAKEMGGSLGVESPGPGLGATFTLELPLQPPKAAYV